MTDVADHLSALVRIPSVSRLSNRPVIEYAAAVLRESQWQTRELPYRDSAGVEKINLVAAPSSENPAAPAADLAFFCHTDTVPYASDWTAAIEPLVRDGLLHGCGSADVKGFLAVLLTAVSETPSHKLIPGLRLALTADEEIGCIGAQHLLASNAVRPRRAVVGEPTSLHPARAGKGYCLAEITVFGKEAHSALPHQGESAIYRAARFIAGIQEFSCELAKEQHPFCDPAFTTLNIGTIQGGTAKNIIPGECRFLLEWRPIPGQPPETVPKAISGIAAKLQSSDPGFRWRLDMSRQQSGFETPADSPLVRSVQKLTGTPAVSIPFASEASLLDAIADEIVVFGPGDMRTAHSNRECVPLSELHKAVSVIQQMISGESA